MSPARRVDSATVPPKAVDVAAAGLKAIGISMPKAVAGAALAAVVKAGWKLTPPTKEELEAIANAEEEA